MTMVHGGRSVRRVLAGVSILSAIGLSSAPRPAWSWSEGDIAPIAQITLDAEVAPRATPGVTAGIAFNNGKRWSGAAGFANKDGTRKLAATDQMRIGSQTKTYTGTIILQMVQEGKISLDDTLEKWLPALNVPQADKITIRNLLDMTSGIPEYLGAPAAALSTPVPCPTSAQTVLDEWVVRRGLMPAKPSDLVRASNCLPNTGLHKMSYSNTNFVLLGMIVEKIAGCGEFPSPSCYVAELRNRVLKRVPGLKATSFPTSAAFPGPPVSDGYARAVAKDPITGMGSLMNPDANEYVDFTRVEPQVPWSAGAMISTADDELIWSSQLATNQFGLLSSEMQAKRITETVPGEVSGVPAQYGLGVYYMRSLLNGANMLGHAGSIPGYTSNVFRRIDNETDYSANVATFSLADQFSAPILVWILDRNVWSAIDSRGNCGSGGPKPYCTGDSVRLSSLQVARALTLRPSGKSYDTYVPTDNGLAPIPGQTPVPTVAFYGHKQSAIALGGAATFTIEPKAALALVGNQSAAIGLKGNKNTVSIGGNVTASGRDVAGLHDAGSGNVMTVGGQVSSSVVWWNPDQQLPGAYSTQIVAVDGDVSAAIDLAGNSGKLTVDGLVQTQRIKTNAVQLRPEARGYVLSIGSQGTVIGPIVLHGAKNALSIAPGGMGLYVQESRALAPKPPQLPQSPQLTATPGQLNSFALRNVPLNPPTDQYVSAGAPGLPPVRRPPSIPRKLTSPTLNETLAVSAPPPSMLVLRGSGNAVTIGGTLIGAIPAGYQSGYTQDVVAVYEQGIGNTLTIGPTGTVIGDILSRGQGTRLRLDGTAKGDVTITGASTVIEGNGRIEGKLTINGIAVTQQGNLKFGPAP